MQFSTMIITLSLLASTLSSSDNLCKQFGARSEDRQVVGPIWIQTIRHCDSVPEKNS